MTKYEKLLKKKREIEDKGVLNEWKQFNELYRNIMNGPNVTFVDNVKNMFALTPKLSHFDMNLTHGRILSHNHIEVEENLYILNKILDKPSPCTFILAITQSDNMHCIFYYNAREYQYRLTSMPIEEYEKKLKAHEAEQVEIGNIDLNQIVHE